jgi:threonine dehydrogenase-like Zn-dependent dehydrogenase
MKALSWHGKGDIRFETVPDPKIEHPRDAILKVTATAICGSDLHIYGGPAMRSGDVVGHETMGEVVEVGPYRRSVRDSGAYSTVFCAGQANKMIAFDLGVSTNLSRHTAPA